MDAKTLNDGYFTPSNHSSIHLCLRFWRNDAPLENHYIMNANRSDCGHCSDCGVYMQQTHVSPGTGTRNGCQVDGDLNVASVLPPCTSFELETVSGPLFSRMSCYSCIKESARTVDFLISYSSFPRSHQTFGIFGTTDG